MSQPTDQPTDDVFSFTPELMSMRLVIEQLTKELGQVTDAEFIAYTRRADESMTLKIAAIGLALRADELGAACRKLAKTIAEGEDEILTRANAGQLRINHRTE